MNAAVDVERQSAEDVAAACVERERPHRRPRAAAAARSSSAAADFTESQRPGQHLRRRADRRRLRRHACRRSATASSTCRRWSDGEIQVFPEYLATVTEFIDGRRRPTEPSPRGDVDATRRGAARRWPRRSGWSSASRPRPPTRTPSPSRRSSPTQLGVTTLSELAEACGDGSLILGGPPECPERPFCQPGLEETYGLEFAELPGAATPAAR